ncbi:hypothetical protein [Pyrococcus kukulkanii]|uniref:Uncharacterized protein n=1 Tax=Pyrococcus kukulkanii TaxID=1609559 RepID=A0ABV4T5W2_9EURY
MQLLILTVNVLMVGMFATTLNTVASKLYNKPSKVAVLLGVVSGTLGLFFAATFESIALYLMKGLSGWALTVPFALTAGVVEELSKGWLVFTLRGRFTTADAVWFGVASGLTFGVIETALYSLGGLVPAEVRFGVMFIHALWTMAFAVGALTGNPTLIVTPVISHAVYDIGALGESKILLAVLVFAGITAPAIALDKFFDKTIEVPSDLYYLWNARKVFR